VREAFEQLHSNSRVEARRSEAAGRSSLPTVGLFWLRAEVRMGWWCCIRRASGEMVWRRHVDGSASSVVTSGYVRWLVGRSSWTRVVR
jgi:hypothetical protein